MPLYSLKNMSHKNKGLKKYTKKKKTLRLNKVLANKLPRKAFSN